VILITVVSKKTGEGLDVGISALYSVAEAAVSFRKIRIIGIDRDAVNCDTNRTLGQGPPAEGHAALHVVFWTWQGCCERYRHAGLEGDVEFMMRQAGRRDVEDLSLQIVVVGALRVHTVEEDRVEVDGSGGGQE
jgi:hypothetical protein